MAKKNISQGERINRALLAVALLVGILTSLGAWFYGLIAVLLLISAMTGQCGTIVLLNKCRECKE